MSGEKYEWAMLSMLAQLAHIDKDIDSNEEGLFYALADRMKCSPGLSKAIWERKESYPLNPPASEGDRVTYLHMSVMMMAVDGDFGARERKLLKHIGAKLALRPEVIQAIIGLFEEHYPKPVPERELVKAYQIPHN